MTSLHKKIDTVSELVTAFKFKGELKNISQLFDGHINDTYIFEFLEKNGHTNKYLVQELNTYVFKEPDALMKNVVSVTDYLQRRSSPPAATPRGRASMFSSPRITSPTT